MARIADSTVITVEGDILPGETRTIFAKDKRGNVIKTITVFRTTRPYVEDLAEAYNNARTPEAISRGVQWYVSPAGELRIGDNRRWQREHHKTIEQHMEAERARHNRAYLESLEGPRWDSD